MNQIGAIIIEGHVQGLSNTRALGEIGVPVIVIDKNNCLARYSKYCKKFFYCPNYIDPGFIVFLTELAQDEGLQGWALIPSNDHAVLSISKNRSKLEEYYKIITPSIEIIENIYDKSKLLQVAQKTSVPIPKTFYFNTSDDNFGDLFYPVLTKGRYGLSFYKATGRKVFLSNNEIELKEHLFEIEKSFLITETFTQELIPFDGSNKTISFTAFCVDGNIKTHWIGEKVREHPIQFGTATFARSIDCEDIIEPSKRLLRELKYTGVCEVEYLRNPLDYQYKLIEINVRTWLWVGLAKECGINFAVIIYNYLNNIPNNYPQNYKIGVNWVNYVIDFTFSAQAFFKRKINLKQYICAFKGRTMNAVFSWKDILPGLMFIFLLLYIAIKRK